MHFILCVVNALNSRSLEFKRTYGNDDFIGIKSHMHTGTQTAIVVLNANPVFLFVFKIGSISHTEKPIWMQLSFVPKISESSNKGNITAQWHFVSVFFSIISCQKYYDKLHFAVNYNYYNMPFAVSTTKVWGKKTLSFDATYTMKLIFGTKATFCCDFEKPFGLIFPMVLFDTRKVCIKAKRFVLTNHFLNWP